MKPIPVTSSNVLSSIIFVIGDFTLFVLLKIYVTYKYQYNSLFICIAAWSHPLKIMPDFWVLNKFFPDYNYLTIDYNHLDK